VTIGLRHERQLGREVSASRAGLSGSVGSASTAGRRVFHSPIVRGVRNRAVG
jgi:hypothetical protein